ncbi:hypothetical protein ALC56_00702 [Trachymyrmex septentrionalis]|uniref:Uncharacterized protein n=1 Tax=Trachymyrmex septentrionalis TaxID=34720 RepID=A0A195FWL9_9HYME|nr:hypothetical protein ALC56_00702 [Trachymyrmex septentrionalis]
MEFAESTRMMSPPTFGSMPQFNLIADRLRRRLQNQIRRRANFGAEGLLSQFSRQAGITSARKIANAVAVADGGPVNAQTRYLPVHA